jgi:hypothetical protein
MSHTYSILEVSARAYAELRARLEAAGHESAFHDDAEHGVVLDMSGVAIAKQSLGAVTRISEDARIEIGSILSSRTNEGMVELVVNAETVQMDLAKAREVHRMLGEAIEAAVSDQVMFLFFTDRHGLSQQHAAVALREIREIRQGSKSAVFPN